MSSSNPVRSLQSLDLTARHLLPKEALAAEPARDPALTIPQRRTEPLPMLPFRFGYADRELYGVFHPSQTRLQDPIGVLLCNPFGQEAVRTHRMYRVLAERLARGGFGVLRFDFFATGDSAGEDDEGELEGWCRDVATAHDELVQRTRCAKVVWLGARLGGTLAAMASTRVAREPNRLVLWDPVLDGPGYLGELAAGHTRALRASYDIVPKSLVLTATAEAMGFAIGSALAQQLARLTAAHSINLRAEDVLLISSASKPDAAFTLSGPRGLRSLAFEHAFDWTSEEALNSALVPSDAIRLLAQQIEQGLR